MGFMGFPNVTPEDVAAGAALLDVVMRIIGGLADWLARREGPLPDGASLNALGVLLEREDVRAELAAKAARPPAWLRCSRSSRPRACQRRRESRGRDRPRASC